MFNEARARRLTDVPAHSEYHHWADYVELLCMTDPDGQFSAERLAEVADFAADLLATSPDAQDVEPGDIESFLARSGAEHLSSFDEQELDEDADLDEDEEGDLNYAEFGRAAEEADNRYEWCQRVFASLESRARALGGHYPFEVDSSALHIVRSELTDERRAYVFLLCCSSLSYVSRQTLQRLTAIFEVVSFEVLKRMLPAGAEVDVYGTARGRVQSRFTGTQFQRLQSLATELRGKVIAEAVDFHPRDRGDNGLDLVAWIPMGDHSKGVPSFFGQSACGRGWEGKQYEASHERWREFIHLTSPSTKVTFIPHYYRKVGEAWYAESEVSGVVIDRLRTLRFMPTFPLDVVPIDLVDAAWNYRLPVT